MATRFYISVDVSKATLDWAVTDGQSIVLQTQTANSEAGIKVALKVIKALPNFVVSESVCCLEHTGLYCTHLLASLYKIHLPLWLESCLQIKKAGGLQRGKTDTIDAGRIAEYAFRSRILMEPAQPYD